MNDQTLHQAPASIEAEQAVLGALMIDNNALGDVLEHCKAADFFRRDHRMIFSAILESDDRGDPFDVVTLATLLDQKGDLDDVGGIQYLGALAGNTPGASNIVSYAKVVKEKSADRMLAKAATEITALAYSRENLTQAEKRDRAESMLMELVSESPGTGPVRASNVVHDWLMKLDDRQQSGQEITGIRTGITGFDEKTLGLQDSDFIVIAGRPSMGKTAFMLNIAEHVAITLNIPTAVFSMEMSTDQLMNRLVSAVANVDHGMIRRARLNDDEWGRVTNATQLLRNAPLFIDDTPGVSVTTIRSRARRLKKQEGIGLIVIDYLQLMSHEGAENRTNEISAISRRLKMLARELNIPVIALSQLSRSVEMRPNKRPIMSDLRESGAIEQDADVIAFLYRDEYYNEDSPDKGTAEVIIRKARNGELGTARTKFSGKYQRFSNFDDTAQHGFDL